ncbi:DUF5666 domain-containing protein [Halioxenophilus aromaticivorans]|uniref:DUF5666 domain-containing protein n=1 Tax=Halioxenophilus aromaticivorans TaxID=1306992 RepID=A0AAV3TWX7_9ALTE
MNTRTTMNKPLNFKLAALCGAIVLGGCNFQIGNGSGDSNDGDDSSSGSDGGASIGVLTDAGGLEVNFNSEFSLAASGTVYLDGAEVDASELQDGMVASFKLEETVPDDLSSGTATEIRANHIVIGPVTSLAPLSVLGQEITVLEETELDGISNDDVGNLSLGEVIRVSGYSNRQGGNIATRIDAPTGGTLEWKITGTVSSLQASSSFSLEDQPISMGGVVPDCESEFADGDYVAVTASPITSFTAGQTIDTTLSISCESIALPTLVNDDDDIDELPAEMEGIVSEVNNRSEFLLYDQEVEISSSVQFTGGEESDLILGAKIEVEGTVDPDSNILTANSIIFHQRPIEIEAPLASTDITANESVTFFGLSVTTNKLVMEDDLIVSSGVADAQVRLNGFVDEEQVPYAIALSIRGNSDDEDVTLKGPVSDVESDGFDVMGISVEGDSAATLVTSLNEEDVVRVENAEVDGSDGIRDGDVSVVN